MNQVKQFFWKLLSTDKFNDFSSLAVKTPGPISKKAAEDACAKEVLSVREDGAKLWYSKPTYMHPPQGYDALCCDDIYVFPSSEQVIPIFFIPCQKLLTAN